MQSGREWKGWAGTARRTEGDERHGTKVIKTEPEMKAGQVPGEN